MLKGVIEYHFNKRWKVISQGKQKKEKEYQSLCVFVFIKYYIYIYQSCDETFTVYVSQYDDKCESGHLY